jgi:beta-lactamase regulating signal transducer with metallopeptidase domain/Leucine-rich repeat (LRR) protein
MMNIFLDTWATTMWRACWQGGLVVLVVWTICRSIPSMPARFQCWLWRLAILKFMVVLLVPWFFNVPLLPAHRAPERIAEITTVAPTIEIHQEPLSQRSVPPPPLPMPTPTPLPILPGVLFLTWIIGIGWSLIRLLAGFCGTVRLRRQGYSVASTSLVEQLTMQRKLFGLRCLPRLLAVEGDGSPMLVGIGRPVVVFPADTLGRLSISEQKMVLGHELAHVKRGDLSWGLVASVVRAVFFFHPLAWLSERQLKLVQEVAADELAIAQQRHDPVSYGELLVSVVGKLGPVRLLPQMSVETAGSLETLKTRLTAMKHIGQTCRRIVVASAILLAGVLLLGLVPWRLVAAEVRRETPVAQPASAETHHVQAAIEPAAADAKTVAEIGRLGGKVTVDEKAPGRPVIGVDLTLTSVTNADLQPIARLTSLQHLNLSGTGVTDAGLAILKALPKLHTLGLEAVQVTDAGLVHLTGLTALRELNLSGTKVTDAGLEHLKGLSQLQSLDLQNVKVTDAGLARLAGLVRLEKLALTGARVTDAGCANLERLSQLKYLILPHTPIGDAGLAHLKGLTRIESLIIGGTKITDAGLKHLEGMSLLHTLWVETSQITDAGLEHLAGLASLQELNVTDTKVGDAGLEHLKGLGELRRLLLADTKLTDAGLKYLAGMKKLEALMLDDDKVTDAGLEHLTRLTQLTSLVLLGTKVTATGVTKLQQALPNCKIEWSSRNGTASMPLTSPGTAHSAATAIESSADQAKTIAEIKKLGGKVTVDEKSPGKPVIGVDLRATKVTDSGLERLKDLRQLQSILLQSPKVTDAGMEHLKGLSQLRQLWFISSEVTDAGLEHLKGLSHLQRLFLESPKVTDVGLKHLKGLSELRDLSLIYAQITDAGLTHLEGLGQLRGLWLGRTKVTDAGLTHLKGLSQLQELHLDATQVTGTGMEHLRGLSQLHGLWLNYAKVTDAGLEHLKGLSQLQELGLQATQVADGGLEHLKGLSHLQALRLTYTKVSDEGVKKLQQALPNCKIQVDVPTSD